MRGLSNVRLFLSLSASSVYKEPAVTLHRKRTFPKGPFRTKNSTALDSVVFCYRRSFSLSVPFSCLFLLGKKALQSTLRSVLLLQ